MRPGLTNITRSPCNAGDADEATAQLIDTGESSEMKTISTRLKLVAVAGGSAALLAGCWGNSTFQPPELNALPANVYNVVGPNTYDGVTDDLLTAGLGKTGLSSAAPGFVDPLNPTTTELRKRAIYTAYRGIIDFTAAGGFGTLYGPNIDINGNNTLGDGKIAGKEYVAYLDDGSGKKNVTIMVQIPASFDKSKACIVTGPSSGSRGVYGAIGTAGDWGLKHGCAVAYTDAGKGVGYQDLMTDKVNVIDGHLVPHGSVAANLIHFASDLTGTALASFNTQFPNRIAYKHLHSQQNPQKAWGQNVLDSIRFAFWALNENYADLDPVSGKHIRQITASNTIVIASSISNGGGASLMALEQDTDGLISGVAVAEPTAQPGNMSGVAVNFGGAAVPIAGKPLVDYFTYKFIYELCASISAHAQAPNGIRPGWFGFGTAPLGNALTQVSGVELQTIATNRCQSLADKGLVTGTTTAQQADAALAKLQAYGWNDPIQNALVASHYRLADTYIGQYLVAYGKFSVGDSLCGLSLANVNATGDVAAQSATAQATLFATSNGLNTGADLIYNDSVGGPKQYHLGVSPTTGRMDGALDAILCLRNLVTGVDTVTTAPLTGTALANSQRVQAGIADTLLSGNLRGKPVVIVQGRSDDLLPVNHDSRAYAAFNSKVEGASSNLRYYEITNGNHFDTFIPNAASGGVQGYDALLVPVHYYFMNAMDLMWAKLRNGTALPASQVVRTTPRGGTPGAAPPIATNNVPKISASPAAGDTISISGGTINVPN